MNFNNFTTPSCILLINLDFFAILVVSIKFFSGLVAPFYPSGQPQAPLILNRIIRAPSLLGQIASEFPWQHQTGSRTGIAAWTSIYFCRYRVSLLLQISKLSSLMHSLSQINHALYTVIFWTNTWT